jgi:putative Mg2+ transporter-C (MgtC) family protein
LDTFLNEFSSETWLSFPVIVARLAVATLLGAIIGFEREWQERPAGLRTHVLVCVAAATVAILTIEMTYAPFFADDSVRIDPIRLIEAVTAGVAFLAAGTIIFARGEVHGLTTGAGMWLASAVGLCAGLGYWQIAILATVFAVVVLALLFRLEQRVGLAVAAETEGVAEAPKAAASPARRTSSTRKRKPSVKPSAK